MMKWLMQYAFHPVDTYTSPEKQYQMLRLIFDFFDTADEAIREGVLVSVIRTMPVAGRLARMGTTPPEDMTDLAEIIRSEIAKIRILEEKRS